MFGGVWGGVATQHCDALIIINEEQNEISMPMPKQTQKAVTRCCSVSDGRQLVSMPMAACAALPPRMLLPPALSPDAPAPISDLKSSDMAG